MGGAITWTLPDASATNEAQTLSTTTNAINLNNISGVGGGTVNLKTVNGTTLLGSGDISISSTNIYNSNGTTTSNRTVTTGNNYFDIRTSGTSFSATRASNRRFMIMDAGNDATGGLILSGGTNSEILLREAGVRITTNGSSGTSGQVLTSNGTNSEWQTPTAPPLDGIVSQSSTFVTVANNGELPLFPGGSLSSISSFSGNGFVKGVSTGVYEVTVVANPTTSDAEGFVQLGLYRGANLVHNVKLYNHLNGEVSGDVIYTFVTDQNSGTFTVRNTSGASRDFDIKRVTVKRVL